MANRIPPDHLSNPEVPAIAMGELPPINEDLPVAANRSHSSRLNEVQSIISAGRTWQCFRLPSNPSSLWCHHNGLDLFLEWTGGEGTDNNERWMGLKYIDRQDNMEVPDTRNSFSLANLSLDAVETSQRTIASNGSLKLVWSNTSLVIKFGHGTPPEDPDDEGPSPVHQR